MALPAKTAIEVARMLSGARRDYFEEYARYIQDARRYPYAIRVGSKTLLSTDTHDLYLQFDKLAKSLRRKYVLALKSSQTATGRKRAK